MIALTIGLAPAAAAQARTSSGEASPRPIFGIWSLGETKNCSSGPAWVFLADGYYAEVELPDRGPFATGLFRDEGSAIAYTHSHMPFPDMMKANELKRLTVVERTADRISTTNYRGVPRIFHRCPAGSLKAPAGQPNH